MDESKKLKYLTYIILILIIIVIGVSISLNPKILKIDNNITPVNQASNLTSQIQQKTTSYIDVTNKNVTVNEGISKLYTGINELKNINNADTVITYNSDFYPNINNITSDILNGFAVIDEININGCINEDQISVNYQEKTCNNERCLDRFGNKIVKNQIIEEMVYREDVIKCTDEQLGYLSFNFNIDTITDKVDDSVLFMQVQSIYMGDDVYNELKLNSSLEYYFSNNIFIKDSNIETQDIIPRIIHSSFKKNNFRQKLLISKSTQNGVSTKVGDLAEIFFRPGQLFLTVENVKNSISYIEDIPDIPADIVATNFKGYSVRVVSQKTNKSAKCIVTPVGEVKIIDGGKDYNNSDNLFIQGNDGLFYEILSTITIAKNFKRLIFKQRLNFTTIQRSVWLLTPPTSLSPQGITKKNKLSQGYIQNFSSQSGITNIKKAIPILPTYSKVNPGTIIMPLPIEQLWVNQKTQSTHGNDSIYGAITKNGSTCTQFKATNGLDASSCSSDIKVNGKDLAYYKDFPWIYNVERLDFIGIVKVLENNANSIIFDTYPDFLLKSVNKFPMLSDPNDFIGYPLNIDNSSIFSLLINFNNTGLDFLPSNFELALGLQKNNKTYSILEGDIILDGSAEWQQISPFTDVLAFREDYFLQDGLKNGVCRVITTSNITKGTKKSFIAPQIGKIIDLNISSANYNNITLPDFNSAKIVDLNTDTLITESSGSSIGQNAKCLLTFTSQGTSFIIETAQIINSGEYFTNGSYGLSGGALLAGLEGYIEGINFTTEDDQYTFKAVSSDNKGVAITNIAITENREFDVSYGLELDIVKEDVISLLDPVIIDGGQNYIENSIIYINQYDSDNKSVFGTSFNENTITTKYMKELPFLTITSISSSGVSLEPAPDALFKNPAFNGINYNFWEDSPGTYTNSPQQIIFYGDYINGVSEISGVSKYNGTPVDLSNYFLNNKIDDSAFTEINFLTSLQIPSFYYQNITNPISQIEPHEGLTLKRFIPYREFAPPLLNTGEIIPTGVNGDTFINYNYCQFIPYGIENLYDRKFSSINDLPTF